MWLFRKTHSLAWLLYVLVAKIHSSVLNSALIAHPNPSPASSQMATTVVGFSIGTERRKSLENTYLAPQQSGENGSNAFHCHMSTSLYICYFCRKYCLKNSHQCICTRVAIIPEVWISGRTGIMFSLIV